MLADWAEYDWQIRVQISCLSNAASIVILSLRQVPCPVAKLSPKRTAVPAPRKLTTSSKPADCKRTLRTTSTKHIWFPTPSKPSAFGKNCTGTTGLQDTPQTGTLKRVCRLPPSCAQNPMSGIPAPYETTLCRRDGMPRIAEAWTSSMRKIWGETLILGF